MLRVAFVLRSTEVHPVFSGLFPPIFRVSRSASFRGILKFVVRPRPSSEDCSLAAWWKSIAPPGPWQLVECKAAAWKSEGRHRFVSVNGFIRCLVEVLPSTLLLGTRPLQSGCLEVSRPPPVCFRQWFHSLLGGSPSLHLALGDPSLAKWLPRSLKTATGLFPSMVSFAAWWKSFPTPCPWGPVPCKVAAWKSQGRHRFVSVNCFSWCLVEDRRYTLPLALCLGPPPASG